MTLNYSRGVTNEFEFRQETDAAFPDQLEYVIWSYYDTVRLTPWDSLPENFSFFQHATGPIEDNTNMWFPGHLPAPCSFLVQEISVRGLTPKICKGGMFSFDVGSKVMWECPLNWFLKQNCQSIRFGSETMISIWPLVHFRARVRLTNTNFVRLKQINLECSITGLLARARV